VARRAKPKRIKPRNPLAPVVRALRMGVKPSARAYTRKTKHKRRHGESGESAGR